MIGFTGLFQISSECRVVQKDLYGEFMESKVSNTKRLIIVRLDAGDDLLLSLQKCAEQHNIKSGWVSMIGGLKQVTYGLYENGTYKNITKKAAHCLELLPTFGNISLKEGKVLVHIHVNAGDETDGSSFGGHLMEGSLIYPFAEVFIQECDAVLERAFDDKTKLWPIKFV